MKYSRKHFTGPIDLGLLVFALLVGCSGPVPTSTPNATPAPSPAPTSTSGTGSAAAPTTVTACGIVTEQDATTALGVDPGAGVAVSAPGNSSCTFGHYPSLVTVNMLGPGGKADLVNIRSADTANSLIDIPGLGDSAFGFSSGPSASVWFSKGDTMVAVVVVGASSGGPYLNQAKAVATAALSHL